MNSPHGIVRFPSLIKLQGVRLASRTTVDPDASVTQRFPLFIDRKRWQLGFQTMQMARALERVVLGTSTGVPSTFRDRLRKMPPLVEEGLWPAQIKAIKRLEESLAKNHPRSLLQMATGSGKTFTAVTYVYRLIKFAGANRVLFLVDRGNLGKQTLKEFQQYKSPYSPFKFTEEFIAQRLQTNEIDKTSRVCISTIQRIYSMLKGEDLDPGAEEESLHDHSDLFKEPPQVAYNPQIPIETFDVINTDECHRSIYNLWRQVLEYFDAFIIGLTATPNKQTFGFFNQNLVMEYPHEQAVADGVNVNYDVYTIRTQITQSGSRIDAGYYVDRRDRETREVRWEELDEDLEYASNALDKDVVALDQIRTVIQTFRDNLFTEIFPGRTEVPKTLIFAKDDSHAEDIVNIVREEFGKGNDFAQKITYKTTGKKPDELIAEFRNSFNPRLAGYCGYDRNRNGYQAVGDCPLHADDQVPLFLRADERTGSTSHQSR